MSPTVEYGVLEERSPAAVVDELLPLYETYDWWADREREDWVRALAETDELVVVRDATSSGDGEPVGAARVLTDYVYYAHVYDVIVRADRRGEGVGRSLVEAVVDHPRLDDVSPSLLAREGLVEFYERCGFERPGAIERPGGPAEELVWLSARDSNDAG